MQETTDPDRTESLDALRMLWAREQDEQDAVASAAIEAAVAGLRERFGHMSFPGGDVLAAIVDEVDRIRRVEREDAPPRGYRKRKISAATRTRIFERDGYRCVDCGGWESLTIDHRIPESRGGADDDENLQTMCQSCNSRKGTR